MRPRSSSCEALREHHIRTAVVTSSVNGALVLETAGIAHLFDTRVDGNDIGRRRWPAWQAGTRCLPCRSKSAARRTGPRGGGGGRDRGRRGRPRRAVRLRDRGRQNRGVTRPAQSRRGRRRPQPRGGPSGGGAAVRLVTGLRGLRPAREGIREALCALGNGYFAPAAQPPGRGRMAPTIQARTSRAATTGCAPHRRAGGGERGPGEFSERLSLNSALASRTGSIAARVKLLSYRQELDLRARELLRKLRFEDGLGRRSLLRERRFVRWRHAPVRA